MCFMDVLQKPFWNSFVRSCCTLASSSDFGQISNVLADRGGDFDISHFWNGIWSRSASGDTSVLEIVQHSAANQINLTNLWTGPRSCLSKSSARKGRKDGEGSLPRGGEASPWGGTERMRTGRTAGGGFDQIQIFASLFSLEILMIWRKTHLSTGCHKLWLAG